MDEEVVAVASLIKVLGDSYDFERVDLDYMAQD